MINDGGKGSKPRPYSVNQKTFDENWNKIFNKDYQDILSTEDCVLDVLEDLLNEKEKK